MEFYDQIPIIRASITAAANTTEAAQLAAHLAGKLVSEMPLPPEVTEANAELWRQGKRERAARAELELEAAVLLAARAEGYINLLYDGSTLSFSDDEPVYLESNASVGLNALLFALYHRGQPVPLNGLENVRDAIEFASEIVDNLAKVVDREQEAWVNENYAELAYRAILSAWRKLQDASFCFPNMGGPSISPAREVMGAAKAAIKRLDDQSDDLVTSIEEMIAQRREWADDELDDPDAINELKWAVQDVQAAMRRLTDAGDRLDRYEARAL